MPNIDTLFWRLSECASLDLILREYKKVVKRNVEAVKEQIRRRRFIIATDYYVKELLIFVKSLIPIEIVLLDRGFYAWGVINALQELKLGYIILVPKYARFKDWLKKGAGLHEHQGRLNRDKTIDLLQNNTTTKEEVIPVLPDISIQQHFK